MIRRFCCNGILDNSDLIACMVVSKDGIQAQRFLAVDVYQMSLVEPETKRLGWGVVKFAGLLQDMQVSGVEDDSRALNITIHKPTSNPHAKPVPILQASFIFADHIRCIIAKQRLAKGRIQARRMKMQRIAALLDLPVQPSSEVLGFGQSSSSSSSSSTSQLPFRFYDQARRGPAFASVDKVPAGFAVAQQRSSSLSSSSSNMTQSDSISTSGMSTHITPAPAAPLAPSLTPAAQPTISLLSDTNTDSLSVDSLTLLPPADPPCLRRFSRDEAAPADPDTRTTPDLKSAENRKDISAAPEEHGTCTRENDKPDRPDSEPAKVSEPDVTSRSREKVETEISAPDPEENLDLEQETEID
ncbi:hypothetical protein QTP70_023298 [Hemibagrus guttatus]|uniref:CLEC16A/TT9 C-terminal domain-containing protein n=1 Tax=Hemibagrus guttatus TaxID=175788 RepID=A0AAE0QGP3_9TELE|nr:hypothetical protein QTP70_023298 [Hemibagrus guttatus]